MKTSTGSARPKSTTMSGPANLISANNQAGQGIKRPTITRNSKRAPFRRKGCTSCGK